MSENDSAFDGYGFGDGVLRNMRRLGIGVAADHDDAFGFAIGLEMGWAKIQQYVSEGNDSWDYLFGQWVSARVWAANNPGCPFRAEVIKKLHIALVNKHADDTQHWIEEYGDEILATYVWAYMCDANRAPENPELEQRDEWIYNQVCDANKTLAEIKCDLNNMTEWKPITTDEGIKKAATRYAMRHDRPKPPRRSRKRNIND